MDGINERIKNVQTCGGHGKVGGLLCWWWTRRYEKQDSSGLSKECKVQKPKTCLRIISNPFAQRRSVQGNSGKRGYGGFALP